MNEYLDRVEHYLNIRDVQIDRSVLVSMYQNAIDYGRTPEQTANFALYLYMNTPHCRIIR